jgi:hypothetical protein
MRFLRTRGYARTGEAMTIGKRAKSHKKKRHSFEWRFF